MKQCKLLGCSRSSFYYTPQSIQEDQDLQDLQLILKIFKKLPFYGYRKISRQLVFDHPNLTWKRVRRIMKRFGIRALFPRRNLSKARIEHKKYPYLLRNKIIRYPNQVWAADITYLKLPEGHVYLVAILDLFSRKVLSWKISNTLDATFCVEALSEALEKHGTPAIFNTDQGCQFTCDDFTRVLKENHIDISMDGKGRALDNIYVERLWRSLKYEDIYIKSYESIKELRSGIQRYFEFYNKQRFHQSHGYLTPDDMYKSFSSNKEIRNAA